MAADDSYTPARRRGASAPYPGGEAFSSYPSEDPAGFATPAGSDPWRKTHYAAGGGGARQGAGGAGAGAGAGAGGAGLAHGAMAPALTRSQRLVNMAGAAGSVALVVSLAWWGWELAVRDLRGVPVVCAIEGPMRVAPSDPGGAVVEHQGLSVNDVAARGGAAPSETLVLAPAPVELTLEDVPGLSDGLQPLAGEASIAAAPAPESDALMPLAPAAPVPMSQEDAVAAALAEALGESDFGGLTAVAADLPPGAMERSPRPRLRPQEGGSVAAAAPVAALPVQEIDPRTLQPGVRLVQFGAYDTADIARGEWAKVASRLGPLMAGKAMVIEAAESGGLTFWRLRGHGFEGEDDARRFCSAAIAENVNCIPVTHR